MLLEQACKSSILVKVDMQFKALIKTRSTQLQVIQECLEAPHHNISM